MTSQVSIVDGSHAHVREAEQRGRQWLEGFTAGGVEKYGEAFNPSDLPAKFLQHIAAGKKRRIQVRFPWNESVWGHVGVTTGVRPVFVLVRQRNQRSSSLILTNECEIVGQKTAKR